MIIFLDFDGVMHPANQRNLFCREEHLARVLNGFQEVEIVISSSWRLTHSLKNMQTFFLTYLRSKVVGVTPVIDSNVQFVRFYEIQKYFADTGNQYRHHEFDTFLPKFRAFRPDLPIDSTTYVSF